MFAVIQPVSGKTTKFYRAKYKSISFYWVQVWEKKPNWKRVYKKIGDIPVVAPDFLKTPLKKMDSTAFKIKIGLEEMRNLTKKLDKPQREKRLCIEDRAGQFCHLVIRFLAISGEVSVATDNIVGYLSLREECINQYGAEVILQNRADYCADAFFSCDSIKLYFNQREQNYLSKIKAPKGIDLPLGTELDFMAAMYFEGEESLVEKIFAEPAKLLV